MLYHLLVPLQEYFSALNIFRYISFRSASAAMTAVLFSFIVGPWIIKKLHDRQIGETIRTNGPKTHDVKAGTPTMGGLIIIGAILVPTLLFARLDNIYIQMMIVSTIWMGIVGFIDDYLKAVKKSKKGLIARYKLLGQVSLGLALGVVMMLHPEFENLRTATTFPFFKDLVIDLKAWWIYIPFVIFVVTATSNSVNLTDGLDGLASGLLAIAALVFAGIAYVTGRADFSQYLNIIYLPSAGELTVFCAALIGASMGFLWFNARPAEVFMGDTGSLALGAALGAVAVMLKKEFLLPFAAGVFILESISVILQVNYFRYTKRKYGEGRRLLRMAPIHHHFELKGWDENKVVIRFWIIGIMFALLTLTTFKIR
ncbi:MAG: phospho-N-acetylmuramoyl-pentapeptide-transferase [Candidatus Marinimicrobia bacterium]|nr:phospho-N-acetylmuramoyl-pentapeptide-transferase [Candidatus Neomarinimicrobiota bacterium]MCF7850114.1 phospho-N-acetylmuramoyl-pentapeptide-transferase [Candidatus Neomarinimicrobiota bacterium]